MLYANSDDSTNSIQIQFLPSAFYTPETNIGFGGSMYSFFKLNDDTITRKSNAQTYVTLSLNKQFSFENDFNFWINKNKYFISGSIDYSKFPELFFGLGNETSPDTFASISFELIKFKTKFLYKIHKNIFGGFIFHCQSMYNEDIDIMPILLKQEIYGTMGYQSKGIGLALTIDNRDNPLNPAKGHFVDLHYIDYRNKWNRVYQFYAYSVDIRKYITLFDKLVWNANIHGEFTVGQVPFRMLPELGGARFLRGYYRGRLRDNNSIVIQNEFRLPIYKRIGFAVFSGLGEVAHEIKDFKSNRIHYNYGMGLRIKINKKENTNLRIDYGCTKDSKGLYIVYAEAF